MSTANVSRNLWGCAFLFARLSKASDSTFATAGKVFVWFSLPLVIAVATFLTTSVFFSRPRDLGSWLGQQSGSDRREPTTNVGSIPVSSFSRASSKGNVEEWRVHYNAAGVNDDEFEKFWIPTEDGKYEFDTEIVLKGPLQSGTVDTHVWVERRTGKLKVCSNVVNRKSQ